MEIIIVTGMSGAGKTTALKVLEDLGFYAIDNLPASLMVEFVDLALARKKAFDRIALVMDIRGGRSFEELFEALEQLKGRGINFTILFMDASDDVLVRRFSETRRIHPLESEGLRVADTIKEERKLLDRLREHADIVVDTAQMNIYELRDKLAQLVPQVAGSTKMRLSMIAFGYKFGIPGDADMVVDVRFLPNPYWEERLKDLSGLSPDVEKYVLGNPEALDFLDRFTELMESLFPLFKRERKLFLTLGVGCTGGRHRSVVMAQELARRFKEAGHLVSVTHRDVDKT